MAPLRSIIAATLCLASAAQAHFALISPESLEGATIDDSKEDISPCGAKLPDLTQTTANDFHVDGDFVHTQLGHQQAHWLVRGTLEDKASGNWTQLAPIVFQSGLGDYCQTAVKAPKEWIGKRGVIGIACKAPDGLLYQCSVVNFVAGANTSPDSSCVNGSTVTASFSSEPALSALVGTSDSPAPAPSPPAGSGASLSGVPLGLITVALGLAGTVFL